MFNIFKDEKTLGDHLVGFHRSHAGQPIERFLRFILPKELLKWLAGPPPKPEFPKTVLMKEGKIIPEGKKKGKGK